MADIDQKISELFQVVEKQKKELEITKNAVDRKWVTNCSLQLSNGNPINIQTASEEVLIRAVAGLLLENEYGVKAAQQLGLPAKILKISGYDLNDWLTDCKKRIAMLQISAKKSKLADLESRLGEILSPEQRRQLELEAITKALSGDGIAF